MLNFLKRLFRSPQLITYTGTISLFHYHKQLIKTVHSIESKGLFQETKRKSVPVYKMHIFLTVLLNNQKEKRLKFNLTDKAENIPFFDFQKDDQVEIITRNDEVIKVDNLSKGESYTFTT